jgi:hypothetical protein
LRLSAHFVIFSRNERYVYDTSTAERHATGGHLESRFRARGMRQGRSLVVAPNR